MKFFYTFFAALLLTLSITSPSNAQNTQTAIFAGGCFWCMEPPYDKLDGVISTISGYAGGTTESPSYKDVTSGGTGHYEVIEVTYDPDLVSYETLLETYWANIDPLDDGGQFCDRGHSYKSAIFAMNDNQRILAEDSKDKIEALFENDIVTPILNEVIFYPAEDYHQNYYQTNATRYKFYRWRCGRDARLDEVWGDNAGVAVPLFAKE
jgi:peptide-methionine (S)-S-oxide reductase